MILSATGHRPPKLGGYDKGTHKLLVAFARNFLHTQSNVEAGISGMALGWDQAWAEALLLEGIPLCLAIPFLSQPCKWSEEQQKRYWTIQKKATLVDVICEGDYAPWKMQKRNEWMVDECDTLIALWDGSDGGTANCVAYAKKVKKPINNLWTFWQRWNKCSP